MEPQDIRLVVWDLDETFWDGTLSEGGIRRYLQEHHDLVIELAGRGIVSSICSKNSHSDVERELRNREIWEYFVFPSISWEPKGPRLAALVEKFKLRPPTVLFVDDQASSRAEAADAVPGIRSSHAGSISWILNGPLLRARHDPGLTRLKHYRLLEERTRQEETSPAGHEEFLRTCDIRVSFEFDVEKEIDRAIELINTTNQLNFTKRRLSDNAEEARREFTEQTRCFWRQAALVRVIDKYGDHGYCGFFLRNNGQGTGAGSLVHYCFSCRIMGMHIERWVYEQLGKPSLRVVGPVAGCIHGFNEIDWIRFSDEAPLPSPQMRIPQIVMRGGCEIDAISHYFSPYTLCNKRESSITRHPFFVSKDCSHHLVPGNETSQDSDWAAFVENCGFLISDFDSALFSPCPVGSLFIFSFWGDLEPAYRHQNTGRLLTIRLQGLNEDLTQLSYRELKEIVTRRIQRKLSDIEVDRVLSTAALLKKTCSPLSTPTEREIKQHLNEIFSFVPPGCMAAVIGIDEYAKQHNKTAKKSERAVAFNCWVREIAAKYNARVFSVGDFIATETERVFTAHFHRIVYHRLAVAILDWVRTARTEQ